MADISAYLQAEIVAIRAFKAAEAIRLKCMITDNDAVVRWIDAGRAAQFRRLYEKRGSNGR